MTTSCVFLTSFYFVYRLFERTGRRGKTGNYLGGFVCNLTAVNKCNSFKWTELRSISSLYSVIVWVMFRQSERKTFRRWLRTGCRNFGRQQQFFTESHAHSQRHSHYSIRCKNLLSLLCQKWNLLRVSFPTASMLDYPGVVRRFGTGATHAIACNSDQEVGDISKID